MKLWHCHNARSMRPLWAIEEMGLDCEVHLLEFPPRLRQPEFLEINPLGTVPYFRDGPTQMTESTGICHYLAVRYGDGEFDIAPDDPGYGAFLNWLYQSDATFTFPQTLVLRYGQLEPRERRQPQVAEDYRRWYLARLRHVDAHVESREYLCGERFTIADIAVGYAIYLGEILGLANNYATQTKAYLERLKARPAFQRAAKNEQVESGER